MTTDRWQVVLWDDDINTFATVAFVLHRVVGLPRLDTPFQPVSADGTIAAEFRERHEGATRAQVVRDRKGELHSLTLVKQLIAVHCQAQLAASAEAWLMPRITAELRATETPPE